MHAKDSVATFQITVEQLTLSSQIHEKDIRVIIGVNDVTKVTCSGYLSGNGRVVTWVHPFFFTASPSDTIVIVVCALPEELSLGWGKKPLGNQMRETIAHILESDNVWECIVPGLQDGSPTLSITCKASNQLIAPTSHDCLSALKKYDSRLYEFNQKFSNMAALSAQVEMEQAILDLCPEGHAHHTCILNDLAISFSMCYDRGGNISDLNRAIAIGQTRLDLCPFGHPEHPEALATLAMVLWSFYQVQGTEADLKRIMEMQQKRLDLCPSGDPHHGTALGNLALSLWEQYHLNGDMKNLDRAIDMEQRRLDLCPKGHPHHDEALGNLAASFQTRHQKQGELTDLDKAIYLEEKHLDLYLPGHPNYGLALQNLACSLSDRYQLLEFQSDGLRAVDLFNKALAICPPQQKYFALIVDALAHTILLLSDSSRTRYPHNQPLPLHQDPFEVYRMLKDCGPAVSLYLWKAIQAWVKNAEKHNHASALEAYQTGLNTLVHFTSLQSSLDSQHEAMQAKVADLANNAFSCAVRHADLKMAVELLEQGRGILWSQLARFDIPIATLESRGHKGRQLAEKFIQLSTSLRNHTQGSGGEGMEPYWRVHAEWKSVVDDIRRQDGFSRFLLPPCFDDLQQAAESGPVIIVNRSEYTSDAIIVVHNRTPIHVPLGSSPEDVDQLCSQFLELIQDPHAYGEHREFWVKRRLRDLWTTMVAPIVAALQNEVQLPKCSRIWWYPTSKFTILPFHASGPHRQGQENLMDLYVSSYAPSLSTLIRTHERARSQRLARSASGTSNVVSFAAVGQAQPSASLGLCNLPEVERELMRIRDETDKPSDIAFDIVTGGAATIEGAVQAFHDHHWVHLACHGAQHHEKPFESWFAMGDGQLTLMRIIRERYARSEFAFLSACHTAQGDRSTPDEVLHLAAGMQFAGFNGVIGTLWRVDDAVAHQVVTRFYRKMFSQPVINFEYAATALNDAVLESTEVSLEKRIVFVHIGI